MLVCVISGGTATNLLVEVFAGTGHPVTYILPVSDNGGSTSEVLRVLGGPAIGDIRSRVTRLMGEDGLKAVLAHRLSADETTAAGEWDLLVKGDHPLWPAVPAAVKEIVRSFLIHVHVQLLHKSRHPLTRFRFAHALVGNMFLTGARLFCGLLDAAVELALRLARVDPRVAVLPCLNTAFTYHILAVLSSGEVITGQLEISHPSTEAPGVAGDHLGFDAEVATPPYAHPHLRRSQLLMSKNHEPPLPAPIARVHYILPYGEEIHPQAAPRVVQHLASAAAVVYLIGSLYTSVVPVLVLGGVGDAIAAARCPKVLLLNRSWDRETFGMSAVDFGTAIAQACGGRELAPYLTHVVYLADGPIPVDTAALAAHGVAAVPIAGTAGFDAPALARALGDVMAQAGV